jgi:hypothetical protein
MAWDPAELGGGWVLVDEHKERVRLVRELRRELPEGHVLKGLRCQPIAKRVQRDDTIWWLPHRLEWALVHLTYRVETDARWPATSTFRTWEGLLADLVDD